MKIRSQLRAPPPDIQSIIISVKKTRAADLEFKKKLGHQIPSVFCFLSPKVSPDKTVETDFDIINKSLRIQSIIKNAPKIGNYRLNFAVKVCGAPAHAWSARRLAPGVWGRHGDPGRRSRGHKPVSGSGCRNSVDNSAGIRVSTFSFRLNFGFPVGFH